MEGLFWKAGIGRTYSMACALCLIGELASQMKKVINILEALTVDGYRWREYRGVWWGLVENLGLPDVHGETKEPVGPGKTIGSGLKIFFCVGYNSIVICILQHHVGNVGDFRFGFESV